MKQKIFTGIALLALVLLLVLIALKTYPALFPAQQAAEIRMVYDQIGIFELEAKNEGTTSWTYTVKAQLPNPCEKVTLSSTVAESFPEQVTITVKRQTSKEMCAQVIKEFSESGTFIASKEATIRLNVIEE